jgi:vacuolar protein sorting-associated protein 13A/C
LFAINESINWGFVLQIGQSRNVQQMFFKLLRIESIRLSVSYSGVQLQQHGVGQATSAVLYFLSKVNQMSLNLKPVQMEDAFVSSLELQNRLLTQYKGMVLNLPQVLAVFGSMDALGNPQQFFTGVGTGVRDLFVQPMQGIKQGDVLQIGKGLAKGTSSFVKHTVGGVGYGVSTITSGFGATAAALTFDSKFQQQRSDAKRDKPTNFMSGMKMGKDSLISGVVGGVKGLVESPREGLQREGAKGLAKGVGKGMVGFITKPISGIADALSHTTKGIQQSAEKKKEKH